MKKFLVLFGITFLMFALAFNAHAIPFGFSGIDEGGTASATLDFQGLGSDSFVITINNTSPTSLNDSTLWANAPAITGVGFNINPDFDVSSWSLMARDSNGKTLFIDDQGGTSDWTLNLNSGTGNIKLDLYTDTVQGGQGGLYNPATLTAPGNTITWGGPPQYFTEAVLTINFAGMTDLVVDGDSPFTRWQNVGEDGEGSLKLTGTPSIPDASSVFLLGSACLMGGLAGFRRKFRK